MALLEFFGYILPDWMVYSFIGLTLAIVLVGAVLVKRRLSNPDEMLFYAWEYLPSGYIPKVFQLSPDEIGASYFVLKEGEKERHVIHSHPWVIPGSKEAVFTIPFGSNKADSPEEMFHRNRNVRTPFPLVDAQADALGRIHARSSTGFGLRKNWFTLLVIFSLGFLAGIVYLSYTKGVPIG